MPQWCLFIATPKQATHYAKSNFKLDEFAGQFAPVRLARALQATQKLVRDLCGNQPPARIYFGCEFCQHLIPRQRELAQMLTIAQERQVSLSLVTPYVTDEGLGKLRKLFDFLAVASLGCEVIVNDWGVLRLVAGEYPTLTPVLGRLLNKMMRAPRVAQFYNVPDAPLDALRALQQSSVTVPLYRRFLKGRGVNRIELDWLVQGIALDFNQLAIKASVYVPFAYVATGRVCLTGSIHLLEKDKFTAQPVCRRECQQVGFEIQNANPRYDPDLMLYQAGNTVFYLHDGPALARLAVYARHNGVDRIVYQPELPI